MSRSYRKYDEDFKQGAVRLVTETGKPIAQVARELGINEGSGWSPGVADAASRPPVRVGAGGGHQI